MIMSPKDERDALRAARGLFFGVLIGTGLWLVGMGVAWLVLR